MAMTSATPASGVLRSRIRRVLSVSGVAFTLIALIGLLSGARDTPPADAASISPAAYQALVGAEGGAVGKVVTFVDKQATPSIVVSDQPEHAPATTVTRARPDTATTRPAAGASPTTTPAPATAPTTIAPAVPDAPPVTVAPTVAPTPTTTAAPSGVRCVVRLHGKGGSGTATTTVRGSTVVSPTGNDSGWGGRQWLYDDAGSYAAARSIVASAVAAAGCGHTVIGGFSNGASFAASLYCHGETFGGRVVGYVVDDPVTDHAVDGCAPAAGVRVAVYWTGALEPPAVAGWSCAGGDWTCQGGTTIGIAAYGSALGTSVLASPFSSHDAYADAPPLWNW